MKLLDTCQVYWCMVHIHTHTHTHIFDIKQFPMYVRLSDGDWSIHILVGVWQMKVWLL
jgi:hypothetical protein